MYLANKITHHHHCYCANVQYLFSVSPCVYPGLPPRLSGADRIPAGDQPSPGPAAARRLHRNQDHGRGSGSLLHPHGRAGREHLSGRKGGKDGKRVSVSEKKQTKKTGERLFRKKSEKMAEKMEMDDDDAALRSLSTPTLLYSPWTL